MKSYGKYIGLSDQLNPALQKLTPGFRRELISRRCNSVDEILYCEAKGSYTMVHLSNEENFVLSMNLKKTWDVLPKNVFARCHRSFLINLNHVKDVIGPCPCKAILSSGKVLDVSARRKKDLFLHLQII